MNTSQFMDKQIMDLSNSQSLNSHNDFIDLINPREDHRIGNSDKKEEILPSYDFQPLRPIGTEIDSGNLDAPPRAWNSADNKTHTGGIRTYSSFDSFEPGRVILEKDQNVVDPKLVSEIDRTMKKYADNLMHGLDSVSARLTQLESRTRHLENSLDELKVSVGTNHGSSDGRMRQLENILREVQNGIQFIRDKQEILDAQLHLAKLEVSKAEQHVDTQGTSHLDSSQPALSVSQQSHQHLPPVAQTPSVVPPNAPPPALQQNLPPQVQLPSQFSHNQLPSVPQQEPYFPPPPPPPPAGQTSENLGQQYQLPPPQQLQASSPPQLQQQYQALPQLQYSQPPAPPQPHNSLQAANPPQHQPALAHHPEEPPYVPSQSYSPANRQTPSLPASAAPPHQQFYGAPPHMYEPPSSRPGPGFSGTYGPASGSGEQYLYGGSSSQYGSGSPAKSQQLSSPVIGHGGGSGYPQLPTARILPQAIPTASGVSGGSGSSGSGNRVPVDDVVDKVTNMGFPRDQVRATVRKLTENGQSVDLNVVLDKLMNDGEVQPPRGWFGR
ncbi:uncharacterized protein [Coffea arabica]|uniref:DUF1421 domain-containing protein n=1 Tax=Coffea arabica TaxID=13443 RepID=A0A6P6T7D6_COFAR|nr:protein transport protein SEC31-like [Coffea arabica]